MLELRPNCEYCDKDLPPNAVDARICTYECTFCAECVDRVLQNVCPNCGGGFGARPIRPATMHRDGLSIAHQPASEERKHMSYDADDVRAFTASLKAIPPEIR